MKNSFFVIASATATIIVLLGSCFKVIKSIEKDLHETKPYPTKVQIGNIESGVALADVIWPNAEAFQLLVSLSRQEEWTKYKPDPEIPEFEGTISITDSSGNNIERIDINKKTSQNCNWLDNESLDAFILTSHIQRKFEGLKAGNKYRIEVAFTKVPNDFSSIWLSYVQTPRQKNQIQSEQAAPRNR